MPRLGRRRSSGGGGEGGKWRLDGTRGWGSTASGCGTDGIQPGSGLIDQREPKVSQGDASARLDGGSRGFFFSEILLLSRGRPFLH